MRTIHETRTADGITIRLIERMNVKPRYVITQGVGKTAGFTAVGNDRDAACEIFIRCVERASKRPAA